MLQRSLGVFLSMGLVGAAWGQTKRFHDPMTDVSFAYPASWRLDASLGDYMHTEILGGSGPDAAIAKVGFQGLPHTNLTTVEFVFAMTMTKDASGCYALAQTENEGEGEWVTIGGAKFWHYAGSDAGLSHSADENIYAFYRERGQQCLLFEEDIDSVAPNIEDWAKPVSPEKLGVIRTQMDAVMRSVVIGAHPAALKRYDDPKEPVSFEYPAGWSTEMRLPGKDMTVDYAGQKFAARMKVGRVPDGTLYEGTDFGGLQFSYTVVPGIGFEQCYPLARKLAGGQGKQVESPIRDYLQIKRTGAAASGELAGELYAEDPSHTCYLWDLSVRRSAAEKGGRELTAQETAELMGQLRRVFRSVSIDWTHPKQ